MAIQQPDEQYVFELARRISDADARSEYLRQICRDNLPLRLRVEALLTAHEKSGFMDVPPADVPTTAQRIAEGPGTVIGNYKLLERIGEGGFGIVFMAYQQKPMRREVALKIIKPGMDTREVVARFDAERHALAMMNHPNIARVFDGGVTDDNRPYFVMELVKGVPITEYCDRNDLSTDDRLRLFAEVCHAVQHAHQKGIIHRDLKPTNIMVTLHDGNPVPKVIDFGVSKAINQRLTEQTLFTSYGQMIGTLQYMSPEQAEMSGLDIDVRSDVYSLGVVLYELLTGSTPVDLERLRTAGYAEIQRIIRDEEPLPPSIRLSTAGEHLTIIAKHRSTDARRLRQAIHGELDWIVLKSLEKERGRRYESAKGLAADVNRFLSGDSVEAHPPSRAYRLRKFIRRNRGLVAASLAVLLTLLVGLAGTTWGMVAANKASEELQQQMKLAIAFADEANRQRKVAEENLATSQERGEKIRRQLYNMDVPAAIAAWRAGRFDEAERILLRHVPLDDQEDIRGFEWRYASHNLRLAREHTTVLPLSDPVCAMSFSPDWKYMAAAHPLGPYVTVWDVESKQQVRELGRRNPDSWDVRCFAAFLPDGERLICPGENDGLAVHRIGKKEEQLVARGTKVVSVAVPSAGDTVVTGNADGTIAVWNVTTWERMKELKAILPSPTNGWHPLALTPDAHTLVAALNDGTIKVWKLPEGEELRTINAEYRAVSYVAVSPDARLCATVGTSAKIWELATGKQIAELGIASRAEFFPDSGSIALVTGVGGVSIRETGSFRKRDEISGLLGSYSLCVSPDGHRLATAGFEGSVNIRRLTYLKEPVVLQPNTRPRQQSYARISLSSDGNLLASVEDNSVVLWYLTSPGVEQVTLNTDKPVGCVALQRDGRLLAAGSDGQVYLWDQQNRSHVRTLSAGISSPIVELVFATPGNLIAGGCEDGQIVVWDAGSGALIRKFPGESQRIRCLAFSLDGQWLASGTSQGLKLWNLTDGTCQQLWKGTTLAVAFSSRDNGSLVAFGGFDGKIHYVNWKQRQEIKVLPAGAVVDTLAFAADGRTLFGTIASIVAVWDIERYDSPFILGANSDRVISCALSADETLLVTRSRDHELRLWRTDTIAETRKAKP